MTLTAFPGIFIRAVEGTVMNGQNYERLNSLQEGIETKRLISELSLNIAQCGIRVFRIIQDLQKRILPLTEGQIEEAAKILDVPDDKLNTLIREDAMVRRRIALASHFYPRKKNRPTDFALNILIFYLSHHFKEKRGKPNWDLIAGFLSEQMNVLLEPSSLKKRADRDKEEDLARVYSIYQQIYEACEADDLDSIIRRQRESQRIAADKPPLIPQCDKEKPEIEQEPYRFDVLFPSWDAFIS